MPRFWVIAPYYFDSTSPQKFEKVWQYDLDHGMISIGWPELGDISALSEEQQLLEHILATYTGESLEAAMNFRTSLHYFCHQVKTGDTVIARRGRKQIAGTGTVKHAAYFDLKKNPVARNDLDNPYPNHIDIRWTASPRNKSFANVVFGMHTVYEIREKKYHAWLRNFA